MTQYEFLRMAESVLKTLNDNGIDAKDTKYIDMFKEYQRLKSEGHKISYIAYYLGQQYECGIATVYRVVKRMEKEII